MDELHALLQAAQILQADLTRMLLQENATGHVCCHQPGRATRQRALNRTCERLARLLVALLGAEL